MMQIVMNDVDPLRLSVVRGNDTGDPCREPPSYLSNSNCRLDLDTVGRLSSHNLVLQDRMPKCQRS